MSHISTKRFTFGIEYLPDNIKMDFKEIGCNGVDWIDLAQDMDNCRALVNAVM